MMSANATLGGPPLGRRDALVALAIFFVALRLFTHSPMIYMGDSKYTLLLTHNLLSKGSFLLDGYGIPRKPVVMVGQTRLDGDTYQIEIVGNHFYNYFPPGSAILSAPFVLISEWQGDSIFRADKTYDEGREASLQHAVASQLMAALAVVFYLTGRLLLPAGWSALVALGGVLGTQVWSTASRALWTHTWGILLLGGALHLLLAHAIGRRRGHPIPLATLLSWTYFVRPTNSIFIVGITVYLLFYHRSLFVRYAATGAAWFAAFVTYSWVHFGKLLPGYYQANRLETTHFREALTGNLISPSRGVLIFVPVALFVLYLMARYWRYQPHRRLVWLTLAVSAGHLLAVSCFVPWYGGWCYGPRYTTELVPWFVLLAVLGTRAALSRREDYRVPANVFAWWTTLAAGGCLLLLSVFINERGANVSSTAIWNEFPVGVDYDTQRVWDWRYPQFLAGLIDRPPPPVFPPLEGKRITFGHDGGKRFLWDGWSWNSDAEFCWSDERRATLIFATDDVAARRLRLCFGVYLSGKKIRQQRIGIRLNGQPLADFADTRPEPREYVFGLPAGVLQRNNVLTFQLPDAASPKSVGESKDKRSLGIALRWLELKGSD